MPRIVILLLLLPGLMHTPVLASDSAPFHLIYRQQNIHSDDVHTTSDLMITIVNLGAGDARDVSVSIPKLNPYLYVDSPVFATTIPQGHQAEILQLSKMPHALIALSESEDDLVWRIAYTKEDDSRVSVEVTGVRGN